MTTFEVGQVYYGTLTCAHGDFPVICTKRTEKTVWFEHVTLPQHYKATRAKIQRYCGGNETAMFHRWYIAADKKKGGDFDLMEI